MFIRLIHSIIIAYILYFNVFRAYYFIICVSYTHIIIISPFIILIQVVHSYLPCVLIYVFMSLSGRRVALNSCGK